MACSPVTFHGVTQAVFDCLRLELQQGGITVPQGNSGQISGHGVEADFQFDPTAGTLIVTVTKKPFFISCGDISGKIHDAVVACGGQ